VQIMRLRGSCSYHPLSYTQIR